MATIIQKVLFKNTTLESLYELYMKYVSINLSDN
jgi:hypothetical protein